MGVKCGRKCEWGTALLLQIVSGPKGRLDAASRESCTAAEPVGGGRAKRGLAGLRGAWLCGGRIGLRALARCPMVARGECDARLCAHGVRVEGGRGGGASLLSDTKTRRVESRCARHREKPGVGRAFCARQKHSGWNLRLARHRDFPASVGTILTFCCYGPALKLFCSWAGSGDFSTRALSSRFDDSMREELSRISNPRK